MFFRSRICAKSVHRAAAEIPAPPSVNQKIRHLADHAHSRLDSNFVTRRASRSRALRRSINDFSAASGPGIAENLCIAFHSYITHATAWTLAHAAILSLGEFREVARSFYGHREDFWGPFEGAAVERQPVQADARRTGINKMRQTVVSVVRLTSRAWLLLLKRRVSRSPICSDTLGPPW